jgi:hypothetical protein
MQNLSIYFRTHLFDVCLILYFVLQARLRRSTSEVKGVTIAENIEVVDGLILKSMAETIPDTDGDTTL